MIFCLSIAAAVTKPMPTTAGPPGVPPSEGKGAEDLERKSDEKLDQKPSSKEALGAKEGSDDKLASGEGKDAKSDSKEKLDPNQTFPNSK